MRKKSALDKRKAQRLTIPLKVKYTISPRKRTIVEKIFSRDISGKGIGLRHEQPLKIGTKLKTLIYFPADPKPISAVSEVIWCRKGSGAGKAYFNLGIKHQRILPKDKERFIFLFCETMINFFLAPGEIFCHGKK